MEENFDEAERAINTLLVPPAVPESVAALFNSEQCKSLTAKVRRKRALKGHVHL